MEMTIPELGGTVAVVTGEAVLALSYRTCDGWCASLDQRQDLCVLDVELQAARDYMLTVQLLDDGRASCTLTSAGGG